MPSLVEIQKDFFFKIRQCIFAISLKSTLGKAQTPSIEQISQKDDLWIMLQHSDPYSKTDFTLLLKILILVLNEYIFDFQIGLKMENAVRAFPSLALISF